MVLNVRGESVSEIVQVAGLATLAASRGVHAGKAATPMDWIPSDYDNFCSAAVLQHLSLLYDRVPVTRQSPGSSLAGLHGTPEPFVVCAAPPGHIVSALDIP